MPEQALAAPRGQGCGPLKPGAVEARGGAVRTTGQGMQAAGPGQPAAGRESEARWRQSLALAQKHLKKCIPRGLSRTACREQQLLRCPEGFLRRQMLTHEYLHESRR